MSARISVLPARAEWDEEEVGSRTRSKDANEDSGVWSLSELTARESAPAPSGAVAFALYGSLVRRIALKAIRSLPRTLTIDDIVSAGWVGMSEALGRRPADMPEEQFEAYASYRIRGAILDYLRALDPLSRRLRSLSREIHVATRELTQRLGRAPHQDELARHLGVSLAQFQRSVADIQEAGVDRLDAQTGFEAPSVDPSPEALASRSEMATHILEGMKTLPERLQIVLSLHYQHDSSLREIGEILGVTESRVCQLHAEAVGRIRAHLEGSKFGAQKKTRRRAS